jgi:dihydrofolate reductase
MVNLQGPAPAGDINGNGTVSAPPTISIIVAASTNDVIGRDGELPWHLPDDLTHFKRLTTGKPIIMGRKTYESIGRPLPDRQNIVMTRNTTFEAPGCDVVATAEAALAAAGDAEEVMIIGGSGVYDTFLPMADRIFLTRVRADVEGDVRFPVPDTTEWKQVSLEPHDKDERHAYAFDFTVYERRVTGNATGGRGV